MSNDIKETSKKHTETIEAKLTLKWDVGVEGKGELPCVLVYSEKKHADYIYVLLSQIESVLKNNGFNPQRLGDEIRSTEDYLKKLEELIENSVLGIVVLDAFRPNVLFEFGFLKGKKKPLILLQSNNACVNVKTLYKSMQDSGLSEKQFNTLKNPRIDCPSHFSDFAGKHIAYIDWSARETDTNHPSIVLRKELEKNKNQIIEETRNVKTRNISPSGLQEFMQPLSNIIKYYYADAEKFEVNELREAQRQITSIVQKHKLHIPNDIYSMIAATYASKAKKIEWMNIAEIIECLNSASNVYQEILNTISIENNPIIYSDTKKKVGDIYQIISQYRDRNENCKKAIDAYEEALKVYTLKRFPMDYAMTQDNLGIAYRTLAEVEAKAENCKNAIKACEEALKVYTLKRFPMDYAMTQDNLGSAYRTLAEVEAKAENCKKAIKACEEALKVYTLKRFPMDYAITQDNLGSAYGTLAEIEAKAENCKKAIDAYEEALKVRTLERFPTDYAMTQNNLGTAYDVLAEVEAKAENCKKAIKACEEALKVYTLKRFPMDYAMTQDNLGSAYRTLAEVEAKAENCKKAIKACEEALKVYTLKRFPMDYAMTQDNLGSAYGTLAEVEAKAENCKNAFRAYAEAQKVFTEKEFPEMYLRVKRNLKRTLTFCEGNKL
ncbi:MAG TPA: hypothetical protein ACFYD0_08670 [Candidatus Wunengus sp. YC65]|uniref:hypothetical protein n=1 Tax=Candidatus Wunengus sp. YC65 TaxID=3367701 RepID=UPI004025A22F